MLNLKMSLIVGMLSPKMSLTEPCRYGEAEPSCWLQCNTTPPPLNVEAVPDYSQDNVVVSHEFPCIRVLDKQEALAHIDMPYRLCLSIPRLCLTPAFGSLSRHRCWPAPRCSTRRGD